MSSEHTVPSIPTQRPNTTATTAATPINTASTTVTTTASLFTPQRQALLPGAQLPPPPPLPTATASSGIHTHPSPFTRPDEGSLSNNRQRPRKESSDGDKSSRSFTIDGRVVNLGTKCRIVQVSRLLVLKQPHPMRMETETPSPSKNDSQTQHGNGVSPARPDGYGESSRGPDLSPNNADPTDSEDSDTSSGMLTQHEWSHFLKNEAQHRWEIHIYELLQTDEHTTHPLFHTNILPVPYISENGMFMLCVHDTLERRMARQTDSPVCDFQRMQWMHGITRALAWLETKGLVYCNLAPRHILLYHPEQQSPLHDSQEDGGEALLCDFSLTEREGNGMPTKYDLRDFRYLATWADKRSSETDIWSLGCLGYFLITGHAPFAELQHRRAMNLLEDRWHPDFWNGEVSTLIPFVSKCWYCEHCAPRGSVTPFDNVQEAAKYWDNLASAILDERNMTMTSVLAPMCRLSYHETRAHMHVLDRMLAKRALFWGKEVIQPLMREAERIDGGDMQSPEGSSVTRRRKKKSRDKEEKRDRKKRNEVDCTAVGVQDKGKEKEGKKKKSKKSSHRRRHVERTPAGVAMTAIWCVVAVSVVGYAVYQRYTRRRAT